MIMYTLLFNGKLGGFMKKIKIILLIGVMLIGLVLLTQKEKLIIYTSNIETGASENHSVVSVLKLLPINKKMSHLALKLSNENFQGKPIVLKEIVIEEGKKIAYFDLQDKNKDISSPDNWYSSFQGSTGAQSTLNSIVDTLLQKEFKGDWIDGINLTYNGQYIEFDHISFENIVYWRK